MIAKKMCNDVSFEIEYDDIPLYFKLIVLFYADDTVVFGTDELYQKLIHLIINFENSKIMIFETRQEQ